MTQRSPLDLDERLERVSDLGDPLEVMNDIIDFEVFRPGLGARLTDRNMIWTFREHLKKAEVMDAPFAALDNCFGLSCRHGQPELSINGRS